MSMHIQVLNLSMNTDDRDLRRLFSTYGSVVSAEVLRDKFNGRSKCNAIVDMPIDKEALQAITSLDQTTFDGKKISVTKHLLKSEW